MCVCLGAGGDSGQVKHECIHGTSLCLHFSTSIILFIIFSKSSSEGLDGNSAKFYTSKTFPLGQTKLIICFSDFSLTNSDPAGWYKKIKKVN